MRHPSSGMSVITKDIIIKNWDWNNIRTGIIRKKVHKNELWYKQLPAQTAQEVCKQLDKAMEVLSMP